MPEQVRSLIVILGLCLPALWLAQKSYSTAAIPGEDLKRRSLAWIGLLLTAFLCGTYWLYAPVAALWAGVSGRRDSNRLSFFLFVLFVIPPFPAPVPGFGVLNYLLDLTHPRLLALVLLIPAWWSLRKQRQSEPFGSTAIDKCLLGYVLLQLGLQFTVDTVTNSLRYGFYAFLDVFLPYYVASRGLRDLRTARDVISSFLLAALLLTPVAAFEYVKQWLLYHSLQGAMGLSGWGMGTYLLRGDSLRALASTGHSLALGYTMVVALALYAFVRRSLSPRARLMTLGALQVGLIAPVSRGPWIGGLSAAAVLLLTGPDKLKRLGRTIAVVIPLTVVVLISPLGPRLIDLMPFIGTVDEYNVVYRQRLFDASLMVIRHNLWLGSFDFLSAPELQEMIQGDGIIDIVNSYLGVALSYGLIGLTLFCGVFAATGWQVWLSMQRTSAGHELNDLGRALLAALAGVVVTIATVSSINNIPLIYWLLAGLGGGYVSLVKREDAVRAVAAPPARRYAAPPRGPMNGAAHRPSNT